MAAGTGRVRSVGGGTDHEVPANGIAQRSVQMVVTWATERPDKRTMLGIAGEQRCEGRVELCRPELLQAATTNGTTGDVESHAAVGLERRWLDRVLDGSEPRLRQKRCDTLPLGLDVDAFLDRGENAAQLALRISDRRKATARVCRR